MHLGRAENRSMAKILTEPLIEGPPLLSQHKLAKVYWLYIKRASEVGLK